MANKLLFILVEGDDDKRFFDEIIKPVFDENYASIIIRKYAHLKNEKIKNFIKSINSMGADYIYVVDINHSPCVAAKKRGIENKLRNIDGNKIIVVIKEIESWYLAGLSDKNVKKFKIRPSKIKITEDVIKEQFDNLKPKKFSSRIDFMVEILKYFSIDTAKQKNKSFNYFVDKYIQTKHKSSGNV